MQPVGERVAAARPKVVSALAARLRNLDAAEEAFAEAALAAVEAWPVAPPSDAAAWLWRTALRKAYDAYRRSSVRQAFTPDPAVPPPTPEDLLLIADQPIPDERLRLIFVCCHPALATEVRAALTLKVVCGLSTERLARAFLVGEAAMSQRLTRAKRKIREAGVPFRPPERAEWPSRLDAVLLALELAYLQAYEDAALAGDGAEFAAEVLRLSGLLSELTPDEPEVLGLAALVRFAEARRPARLDADGAMTPLSEQDPGLWRPDLIAEGARLLDRAADLGRPGPYQALAAVHAAHLRRRDGGPTPWADIARLYDVLDALRGDPPTRVNRAVALGEAYGPQAGLSALPDGDGLDGWLPYHAARAGLLERAGRREEAVAALNRALALAPPRAERLYLERKLREIGG